MPDLDRLGKRQAARKRCSASRRPSAIGSPRGNVEQTLLDQPGVHRAVEPLVEDGVVDVAVGVIVGPAGGEAAATTLKSDRAAARLAAHQAASYSRRASSRRSGTGLFTSSRVCFIASLASIGESSSAMP